MTESHTPIPTDRSATPTENFNPRENEAIRTAHEHLGRAFDEWQTINPFDDDDLVQFSLEAIQAFDVDALLTNVEKARNAISRGQRDEHRNHPYVASLKAIAGVAEFGGRSYDAAGRAYSNLARHSSLYMDQRDYGRATEAAREALNATVEIGDYTHDLKGSYQSIIVDPDVDSFDVDRWGNYVVPLVINFHGRQQPVMRGCRTLAAARKSFVEADRIVRERDVDRMDDVEEKITSAIEQLQRARELFQEAIDQDAALFRSYWLELLFCHSQRFEDPFKFYKRGVQKFRAGDPATGEEIVVEARSNFRDAMLACA